MSKYLISFKRSEATALLEYNDQGYLLKYHLEPGSFEEPQFKFLTDFFPKNEATIKKWIDSNFDGVKIELVQEDLSFERFYNAYDHKVSGRKTAEKIWNKMSDKNKILAIKYISKYDAYLRKSGVNKKHPETYLNQEIWNN